MKKDKSGNVYKETVDFDDWSSSEDFRLNPFENLPFDAVDYSIQRSKEV